MPRWTVRDKRTASRFCWAGIRLRVDPHPGQMKRGDWCRDSEPGCGSVLLRHRRHDDVRRSRPPLAPPSKGGERVRNERSGKPTLVTMQVFIRPPSPLPSPGGIGSQFLIGARQIPTPAMLPYIHGEPSFHARPGPALCEEGKRAWGCWRSATGRLDVLRRLLDNDFLVEGSGLDGRGDREPRRE